MTSYEAGDFREWQRAAKACWHMRKRPSRSEIEADFHGVERDLGKWMATFQDFEIDPPFVRQMSTAFHYLRAEYMDFFLFSFLRANLLDRLQADVSVRLAAEYIGKSTAENLSRRFSREELRVLSRYFSIMQRMRGFLHETEELALRAVESARKTRKSGPSS